MPNYLWSRPVTPVASIRDCPTCITATACPCVLADANTDAIAAIMNVLARPPRWLRALAANPSMVRPGTTSSQQNRSGGRRERAQRESHANGSAFAPLRGYGETAFAYG
jgi:hypothetical protein